MQEKTFDQASVKSQEMEMLPQKPKKILEETKNQDEEEPTITNDKTMQGYFLLK